MLTDRKLLDLLLRARGLSLRQLSHAAGKVLISPGLSRLKELRRSLSVAPPAREKLRLAVKDALSVDEAIAILDQSMGPALVSPAQFARLRETLEAHSKTRKALLERADRALRGEYELLGGELRLKDAADVDWHLDFKSGHRWDWRVYSERIPIVAGNGSDIKVPWELSRLQHLPAVAYAWVLTDERRYVEFFANQVVDWILKNPCSYGVNWVCTMDVAMRATSLCWAYSLLRESVLLSTQFKTLFFCSILDHGRHIATHLENDGVVVANHYLADLSGLAFLAETFPGFDEAGRWRSTARSGLEVEIRRQVLDDGGDFEASTSYHRLVVELLVLPALLIRRGGEDLSSEFWLRLRKMFVFTGSIQKCTGRVPQIGDNDSGKAYRLVDRTDLDHAYLNTLGAAIFPDPELNFGAPVDAEAALVAGPDAFEKIKGGGGSRPSSSAFAQTGLFIIRASDIELFIWCGANGQGGNGGHAHNDKLSFELTVNGADLIVDPGTGVYTANPALRNAFRSSFAHSTAVIRGTEQSPLSATQLFYLEDRARAQVLRFEFNQSGGIFVGELSGLAVPLRRTFNLNGRTLSVIDEIQSSEAIVSTLPFPPATIVVVEGRLAYVTLNGRRASIEFSSDGDSLDVRLTPTKYSPAYGRVEDAVALRASTRARKLETTIRFDS